MSPHRTEILGLLYWAPPVFFLTVRSPVPHFECSSSPLLTSYPLLLCPPSLEEDGRFGGGFPATCTHAPRRDRRQTSRRRPAPTIVHEFMTPAQVDCRGKAARNNESDAERRPRSPSVFPSGRLQMSNNNSSRSKSERFY